MKLNKIAKFLVNWETKVTSTEITCFSTIVLKQIRFQKEEILFNQERESFLKTSLLFSPFKNHGYFVPESVKETYKQHLPSKTNE